jgi:hypothetical protein
MCQPVDCATCGKTTWTGCGQHVDEALAGGPDSGGGAGHDEESRAGFLARFRS